MINGCLTGPRGYLIMNDDAGPNTAARRWPQSASAGHQQLPPSKNRGFDVTARRGNHRSLARFPLIGIVILSVIHIPLPQADYHNVRHHDGPGEVCVHHDHLLRWHPRAHVNADLTLLHWHWFLPMLEPGDPHQRSDDDHHRPGSGPALHAHVGDGLVPEQWRREPLLRTAGASQLIDQLTLHISDLCSGDSSAGATGPQDRSLAGCTSPVGSVRAHPTAIFQRWNC